MTDASGSTFAHKLATVSLVIVGAFVALIAHYALSRCGHPPGLHG